MEYYPAVLQAVPGEGYTVYAYFSDGSVHLYDAGELIASGGVFAPLADKAEFDRTLTVLNDTVAWDLAGRHDPANCLDVDPFTVYGASIVDDPLRVGTGGREYG